MAAGVKAGWILLSAMLILFSSFEDSSAGGIPSFCNIHPVIEGGDATLTCTFTDDIAANKSDFEIDRYSSTNYKQETLLVCTWNNDEPTCYLNPRITFDRVVTNTLKIKIPNVTSVDAGKYICYVLPTPNGISKSCNLKLEETTFTSETYTTKYQVLRRSDIPIIDISTSVQDSKEGGIMSISIIGIISGVNVAIFILQGICCFTAFRYLKRRLGDGTKDNVNKSKKKRISNIKKITDEEDRTQLRGLLEKDTPIGENIQLYTILTSSSEEGIALYKEKHPRIIPLSWIFTRIPELQTTDSGIVLDGAKETPPGENIPLYTIVKNSSEEETPTDSGIALHKENEKGFIERKTMSGVVSTSQEGHHMDSNCELYNENEKGFKERKTMSGVVSTFQERHSMDSNCELHNENEKGFIERKTMSGVVSTSQEGHHMDSNCELHNEKEKSFIETKTMSGVVRSTSQEGHHTDSNCELFNVGITSNTLSV